MHQRRNLQYAQEVRLGKHAPKPQMNLWSQVPNLNGPGATKSWEGSIPTRRGGVWTPSVRRESAPPQVQPHPQGTSRELPVWNSCCFALQSPRPGDRRKRNSFPSKPTHGPQKSYSHSGFGIWLSWAGCWVCRYQVTGRNGSESPHQPRLQ